MNSNNRSISYLFVGAILLLSVAFLTITNTFCIPDVMSESVSWDVFFTEPMINGEDSRVIVSNDKIDFNVSLKKSGDMFSFVTSVNNDGTFDAVLSSLKITDLSKIVVGTSNDTGKTYYISDYVSYNVKYLDNNGDNRINVGADLKIGDKLNKNTKNNIVVTVKYRDIDKLTNDQIRVLNENIKREDNYLAFNLDLSLSAVYQQL